MSRAERLLGLIQALRRRRAPVTGDVLADELGVSLRTLYRDIASLKAQGAHIEGEPGIGYVLRPGFLLPPLMFTDEEIEALVLGARWIAERTDSRLAATAHDALVKIAAVLPEELRGDLDDAGLFVSSATPLPLEPVDLSLIRRAIRTEHKLLIRYEDANQERTQRTIWPIALAFFDRARVVAAWCELRQGFRHFRTDRIAAAELRDGYPTRRRLLLKEWHEVRGTPARPSSERLLPDSDSNRS